MVTWSLVGAPHGPLSTVHWNTFAPMPRPVIVLVGEALLVIVPCPLTRVQVPVAGKITALPVIMVEVVGAQSSWSAPALATGLLASNTKMLTSSNDRPQAPLSIVQRNTFSPTDNPVTVVDSSVASAKVPLPWTTDQLAVARPTAPLAASTTELVVEQISWSGPASACWALPLKMLIATWSLVMPFAQGPLSTVHSSTTVPTTRPVIWVFGSVGSAMVAVPLIKLHCPVAGKVSALPCRLVLVIGVHRSWSVPAFATGLA